MKRKERLAKLTAMLRDGTEHQGADLARALNVSLRTLYRDMATLEASGISVSGTRGIGYQVERKIDLPHMSITPAQMEALQLGLAAVAQSSDAELRSAATKLATMLDDTLPELGAAPSAFTEVPKGFSYLPTIRQAIRTKQKLLVSVAAKPRTLRPLALDYWGRLWLIVAWCETERGFVELRLDELDNLQLLPSLFVEEVGKSLADLRSASA